MELELEEHQMIIICEHKLEWLGSILLLEPVGFSLQKGVGCPSLREQSWSGLG